MLRSSALWPSHDITFRLHFSAILAVVAAVFQLWRSSPSTSLSAPSSDFLHYLMQAGSYSMVNLYLYLGLITNDPVYSCEIY